AYCPMRGGRGRADSESGWPTMPDTPSFPETPPITNTAHLQPPTAHRGDPEEADAGAAAPLPLPRPRPPLPAALQGWTGRPGAAEHAPAGPVPPPGYRIRRGAGGGGMGVVYEAERLDLKRTVAVKVLHPALPLSPEHLARCHAEAGAVARLRHPGIVDVYERGEVAGRPYLVMEFVGGESLAARLA